MTSLKSISMSELVERGKGHGLGITKSGVNKNPESKEGYVDPFTLGVGYPVEFTAQKVTKRPAGTPQIEMHVSIMQEDGSLAPAGRVWLDLPVKEALVNIGLTAPQEAIFLTKAGEKMLKFLRAIDPERYCVFKTIDRSDATAWKFLGFDGQPMPEALRDARALEIDAAAVAVAEGLYDGSLSVVGMRCILTKQPNANAPRYPYVNYSAFPTE